MPESSSGNNVLIPFDCMLNLDFGIIKVLQKYYNNPKFFENNILNNQDLFFRFLTTMNEKANIIWYLLKEEFKDNADSIRKEIMETEYKRIIEYSEPTNVCTLARQFNRIADGAIKCSIICKNEFERDYIKKLDPSLNAIIDDLYNMDLSIYDSIYIRDIEDILKMKKMVAKNIFIMTYKFNFDDNFENLRTKILSIISGANEIYTIDVYTNIGNN